ncbi:uncharacterized protein LOC135395412 isoform X3 [Ornithodoros turicata]|uniref:uncharacterized protein LOC135395412 isoform X3 n=1 Tax=Ornithodoros turicata TaxID=34597 RepID=UPI00313A28B8
MRQRRRILFHELHSTFTVARDLILRLPVSACILLAQAGGGLGQYLITLVCLIATFWGVAIGAYLWLKSKGSSTGDDEDAATASTPASCTMSKAQRTSQRAIICSIADASRNVFNNFPQNICSYLVLIGAITSKIPLTWTINVEKLDQFIILRYGNTDSSRPSLLVSLPYDAAFIAAAPTTIDNWVKLLDGVEIRNIPMATTKDDASKVIANVKAGASKMMQSVGAKSSEPILTATFMTADYGKITPPPSDFKDVISLLDFSVIVTHYDMTEGRKPTDTVHPNSKVLLEEMKTKLAATFKESAAAKGKGKVCASLFTGMYLNKNAKAGESPADVEMTNFCALKNAIKNTAKKDDTTDTFTVKSGSDLYAFDTKDTIPIKVQVFRDYGDICMYVDHMDLDDISCVCSRKPFPLLTAISQNFV